MFEDLEVDIIILSYAQNEDLRSVTTNCINSLMASEDPNKIKFNVMVIESENSIKPFQYEYTTTVYPEEPFGYHKYMNIGIGLTFSPLICLCNNDLIFHKSWATEILLAFFLDPTISSASPACSIHHPKMGFKLHDGLKLGYRIRYEVAGWCIFLKRDVFRRTGKLDNNYIFWAADNDYANTIAILNLKHVLVTSSIVDHLESTTLNYQDEQIKDRLTKKEGKYLRKKWASRLGEDWKKI